ncbi:MAG: alpha/beta hydrolase [Rhizobiaceae bacterium]|nr:alpha/beta hydrolase [Rhizobiaceae bacterium]
MSRRWIGYGAVIVAVLAAGGYAAYVYTPWPKVWLIRYAFARDAQNRNAALEKHVPSGVAEYRDVQYSDDGSAFRLDVFYPASADAERARLPTVVWIHGGAFIAGDRSDLTNYLRILAGQGYTTVAVGYPLAPGETYPMPVMAANIALGYLELSAAEFHIDTTRLVLVGDSAGAQIAAQLAAVIADPAYADAVGIVPTVEPAQIRAVALFCGVYDVAGMDTGGEFGGFLRTVMWSYFGTQDMAGDPRLAEFSVSNHVTQAFPPAFVSVGNADPLAPQSRALIDAFQAKGVAVDTLLFADDYQPPLQHEYQFDLDSQAGREAFERLGAFLARHSG